MARRDSGERDPKIKKGPADGPSPETDTMNALRDMLSRQEAKTEQTFDSSAWPRV